MSGITYNQHLLAPRSINNKVEGKFSLDSYFLGGREIASTRVSSLLVSSSYGANAILYATWLGYVMGIWAMLIHVAWCISFVLLSRFIGSIYHYTSLHDFLGSKFGEKTQRIAGFCSALGMLYFVGWEVAIAQSGIESVIVNSGLNSINLSVILSLFIGVAILYTVIGGRKTSSIVDSLLNIIKTVILGGMVLIVIFSFSKNSNFNIGVLVPKFSTAMMSIGVFGFVTNFIFNLSWQFSDNSTWHSINSGSYKDLKKAKRTLVNASSRIFIVYLLGTILGASLRFVPDLNSDNILGSISGIVSSQNADVIVIAVVVLLLFSVMSLFDSMSLSVAQTIMVDIGLNKTMVKLRNNKSVVWIARIITFIVCILAAWGVRFILNKLGSNIFDFVYILVVAQLSIIGPVLVGLLFSKNKVSNIWISIVFGLVLGLGANIIGGMYDIGWMLDSAGALSAIMSTLVALLLAKLNIIRIRE